MRTDNERASTLRRIVWVFPERESRRRAEMFEEDWWIVSEKVAEELGMTWTPHAPDEIAVDYLDSTPRVYVAGQEVTPADTLFITMLYSLPYQATDVFNQYAIYAVLEQCGFYLPSPPWLSPIVQDKLATILFLKDSPVPVIPTVRIGPGRDLGFHLHEPALRRVTFPAIVKPTGWCAGWGVNLAKDAEAVQGLLSLAQGGETPLAIQPYLGPDTVDLRVYLVDGEPHTVAQRSPAPEGYVGSLGRDGRAQYAPLPAELAEPLKWFAAKIPIPYLCVDFLFDGDRYWFSEIEPDGGIFCPDPQSPTARERQRSIIEARFRAYRRGHARWLDQRAEEASHA